MKKLKNKKGDIVKNCPICNKSFEDHMLFCTSCGTKLPEAVQEPPMVVEPVAQSDFPETELIDAQPVAPVYTPPVAPVYTPPVTPAYVPGGQPAPAVPAPEKANAYNHTKDFEAEDIEQNKLYAMLIYVTGVIGIIIGKLVSPDSKFLQFHIRQYVKIIVAEMLCAIFTVASCWLGISVLAFGVICVILLVVRIICFFKTASGNAEEVPILRGMSFLK